MPPKILLADDSVTVQKVIELTFHDEGMEVIAVGDGQEAIDCLERERPDIVLADVSMPERDGYAVAAFIKATPSLAHIPVVLMTGAFEQIDDARAREVGCRGVLNKPFEPQMVIALVRRLLGGSAAGLPTPSLSGEGAAAPVAGGFPFDAGVTPAPARTLDDYFDRLDEALAARAERGTAAPAVGARTRQIARRVMPRRRRQRWPRRSMRCWPTNSASVRCPPRGRLSRPRGPVLRERARPVPRRRRPPGRSRCQTSRSTPSRAGWSSG